MQALFNDRFVVTFGKIPTDHEISFEPGTLNQSTKDRIEVSEIIKQFNVSKSTGHDKSGNLVPKMCHDFLNKWLTFIFQTWLSKIQKSVDWKTSQVAPIIKEGNKVDVCCYRPNSLICYCSKVFERVIFNTIYKKIKDRLVGSQFGFRKRSSAIIQLLLFLNEIYELYDKSEMDRLAVLCLDFAKALDTVPHGKLVEILRTYGIGCYFFLSPLLYDK